MQVSLLIAAPAAAASLAYLNARTSFGLDRQLLWASYKGTKKVTSREKQDRLNFFYTLEEHAQSRQLADVTFLWYEGQEWTYKQTYDIVLKYGTWLKTEHGVKPKDIVAMDMMNSSTYIFLWFGIWSVGATPAFINYNLTRDSLTQCVNRSTAKLLLVGDDLRTLVTQDVVDKLGSPDTLGTGKDPVKVVFMTLEIETQISHVEGIREPDECRSNVKGHEPAYLIFTSGTTGLPKPAIVPWRTTNAAPHIVELALGWKRSDRIYTCMPLYHTSAATLGLCTALGIGSSIAIGRRFSTQTFWKDVRDSHATIIQYVGETCRYLLATPPEIDPANGEILDKKHNVRIAFGNGLRPDVWDRFKQRFNIETIAEMYGQTEGVRAFWNVSSNNFGRGAVGRNGTLLRLLPGSPNVTVEVDWGTEAPWRDPKTGFCKKTKPNELGELIWKVDEKNIDQSFPGYHNNQTANKKKVLRDVFTKGDAWYRTGDVFRYDLEGRWYFQDRIGDTYRWKSENVSTTEVSAQLGQHPSIQEANVYGVTLPHHDGRAGMATIILNPQYTPTPQTMSSIAAHVTSRLPAYAIPLFLRVTKEMQLTGTNKQMKVELSRQGVDPNKVVGESGDLLYWFKDGTYQPFGQREWERLRGGGVRL